MDGFKNIYWDAVTNISSMHQYLVKVRKELVDKTIPHNRNYGLIKKQPPYKEKCGKIYKQPSYNNSHKRKIENVLMNSLKSIDVLYTVDNIFKVTNIFVVDLYSKNFFCKYCNNSPFSLFFLLICFHFVLMK